MNPAHIAPPSQNPALRPSAYRADDPRPHRNYSWPTGEQNADIFTGGPQGTDPSLSPTGGPHIERPRTPEALTPMPVAQAPGRTRRVSTTQALAAALSGVQPGDNIVLSATGTFEGPLVMSDTSFVSLTGEPGARITSKNLTKPVLTLTGCQSLTVANISLSGGQKGLMVKGCTDCVFTELDIGSAQMEGLHLRDNSCNNTVQRCTVHDMGLGGDKPAGHGRTQADDGEGIYIGTAKSNNPSGDRSNGNIISNNRIYNTTAENIDIKEFSAGGTITGNELDGSQAGRACNAMIEVKGSGYTVTGNTVRNAQGKPGVKISVIQGALGSGQNNISNRNEII